MAVNILGEDSAFTGGNVCEQEILSKIAGGVGFANKVPANNHRSIDGLRYDPSFHFDVAPEIRNYAPVNLEQIA
jgi:hypothetical protein